MIDFIIYIIEWLFGGFLKKNAPPIQIHVPPVVGNVVLKTHQPSASTIKEPVVQISGAPNTATPLKPTAVIIQSQCSFFNNSLGNNNLIGHLKLNTVSAFSAYNKNK